MSPRDQKIIKANPNATIYELQMTHGLSQGGVNELISLEDQKTTNALQAKTPVLSPNIRAAIPVTTIPQPGAPGMSEQVVLRSKNGSGQGTPMDRTRAAKMVKKYPKDYEIV